MTSLSHLDESIDEHSHSVSSMLQTAHVLWLASDHLHLYIDASPDYALDEIVYAIKEYLEHEMAHLLPAWQPSNQPVWAQGYFAESLG